MVEVLDEIVPKYWVPAGVVLVEVTGMIR